MTIPKINRRVHRRALVSHILHKARSGTEVLHHLISNITDPHRVKQDLRLRHRPEERRAAITTPLRRKADP